jgi:hypothetical protein
MKDLDRISYGIHLIGYLWWRRFPPNNGKLRVTPAENKDAANCQCDFFSHVYLPLRKEKILYVILLPLTPKKIYRIQGAHPRNAAALK